MRRPGQKTFEKVPSARTRPLPVHGLERRDRRPLEAELAVGVVLDDPDVVLLDDLHELAAALERPGAPRRVLEVRDDVDRLRVRVGAQRLFEGGGVHPVVVGRHLDPARADDVPGGDRAEVGRALAEDDVPLVEEELARQVEALLRAGRDEDLVGGDVRVPGRSSSARRSSGEAAGGPRSSSTGGPASRPPRRPSASPRRASSPGRARAPGVLRRRRSPRAAGSPSGSRGSRTP